MTQLTIGDRTIEIAPYKLSAMAKAAPYIDRVISASVAMAGRSASDPDLNFATTMLDVVENVIEVIAVGTATVDPSLTAVYLGEQFGLDNLPALQVVFAEIIRGAGIALPPVEVPAKPAA